MHNLLKLVVPLLMHAKSCKVHDIRALLLGGGNASHAWLAPSVISMQCLYWCRLVALIWENACQFLQHSTFARVQMVSVDLHNTFLQALNCAHPKQKSGC